MESRTGIVDLVGEEDNNKRGNRSRNCKLVNKPVGKPEDPLLLAKIAELERSNEMLKNKFEKERAENKINEKKRNQEAAELRQQMEKMKESKKEFDSAEKEIDRTKFKKQSSGRAEFINTVTQGSDAGYSTPAPQVNVGDGTGNIINNNFSYLLLHILYQFVFRIRYYSIRLTSQHCLSAPTACLQWYLLQQQY